MRKLASAVLVEIPSNPKRTSLRRCGLQRNARGMVHAKGDWAPAATLGTATFFALRVVTENALWNTHH
jgi:hypothetical protein